MDRAGNCSKSFATMLWPQSILYVRPLVVLRGEISKQSASVCTLSRSSIAVAAERSAVTSVMTLVDDTECCSIQQC